MTEQFRKSTLIIAPKRSGTNFTHDLLAPYHKSALNEPIGLHSELNYQNNGNPLSPWIFSSSEQVSEEFGHSGLKNDTYGSLLTRNFIDWLREGGKLIKETDFLYLGWLVESVPFNVVSIERALIVQEVHENAKYIPYGKNGLYVAETLSTNSQFAQFLNWLIEQNFPTEINGRPLFYNDRPQSRIHIDNKIISIEKGYEDHPATFVTWFGAAIFSIWLGGRLPTQKEWKKAIFTRGSELESEQILFSKDHENVAQYYGNTTPVRFFPPNQFGVYDEIGNVSIWLSNPEDDNPFEKLKAGLEWNHSSERGILPNPRPHWLGTSGLGIRVVFDEVKKINQILDFPKNLKI